MMRHKRYGTVPLRGAVVPAAMVALVVLLPGNASALAPPVLLPALASMQAAQVVSGLDAALEGLPLGEAERGQLRAACLAAVALGAETDLLAEALTRGAEANLDFAALSGLAGRVHRIAAAGLPTRPVLSRYLQGMAKGIPFARIDAVADGLEARLVEAAEHLDRSFPPGAWTGDDPSRLAAIDHTAYALASGVEPEYLDRSLSLISGEETPLEAVRAPVLALSLLVSAGVQGSQSFEVVRTAWQQGFRGADLERLGEAVVRLGQSGQAPGEIVEQVLILLVEDPSPEVVFEDLDALQGEAGEGMLPPGPAGGDHPTRRRVPGDRPDNMTRDNGPGGSRGSMPDQSSNRF